MAEKCGKCDLEITHAKDSIKCSDCGVVYHVQCARNASAESSRKTGTRKSWKCDACTSETSSTSSKMGVDRETANASVLEAIAAFRKENNERWDQSLLKLEKMQTDIKDVTVEVSALKQQLESAKELSARTTANVEALKVENKQLNNEVAALKREVSDLQQHSRKNNLLISGVPVTNREDVYGILANIARLLNLKHFRYDVSAAHRLTARRGDRRPPSIVVCFVSRSVRADWIAAMKARRTLTAVELDDDFPDNNIYINEHLTAETRTIFNGGRALVREKKLASVWVHDGRVLVRDTPTGQARRVRQLAELQQPAVTASSPSAPPPSQLVDK